MKRFQIFGLTAFSLTVLATMLNVACSSPTELDQGTTEDSLTAGYGYGYGYGYGGYGYAATNLADDVAPGE